MSRRKEVECVEPLAATELVSHYSMPAGCVESPFHYHDVWLPEMHLLTPSRVDKTVSDAIIRVTQPGAKVIEFVFACRPHSPQWHISNGAKCVEIELFVIQLLQVVRAWAGRPITRM